MATAFSKAWGYLSKPQNRRRRKGVKAAAVRLERRQGKRLAETPVKRNERDVT